jgi:hypothetical protein
MEVTRSDLPLTVLSLKLLMALVTFVLAVAVVVGP